MRKRDNVRKASMVAAGIAMVAALGFTGANGAAASLTRVSPRVQPNGVNFTIHSEADQNFCLEDSVAPDNPASEASISQCAARDNQHWTFAHAADGSIVIIGGSAGDCLDFSGKKSVSMNPCTFGPTEHFFYNKTGQIENTAKTKCLEAEAATQNASTFVVKCEDVPLQIWPISH
jgi:hypothetical protein